MRVGGRITAISAQVPVPSAVEVAAVTTFAAARDLVPAWTDLHARSATTNPFTHPAWLMAWARHFVGDGDLCILAIRRGSTLIGVAPFYWVRLGWRRLPAFRSLHLLGNGRAAQFTEIPGILARPDDHRVVLRAAVDFLQVEAPTWDWVKLTTDSQQGWFEPQWLNKSTGRYSSFYVHQATRACVVVDLPDSWDHFLATRKKNVRESIRRSFNRLEKRVGDWSVDVLTDGPALSSALATTIELHGARSGMRGKPNHPTMFGPASAQAFYHDAVVALAGSGHAEVSVLCCRGRVVAGLVALRANSHVYASVTGADPDVWDLGPGTIMISELARREITRGTAAINLSAGPNQSKLRWSERLEFNHDFVLVGPGAVSRTRAGVYSVLSNLAAFRRAERWDTRDAP